LQFEYKITTQIVIILLWCFLSSRNKNSGGYSRHAGCPSVRPSVYNWLPHHNSKRNHVINFKIGMWPACKKRKKPLILGDAGQGQGY